MKKGRGRTTFASPGGSSVHRPRGNRERPRQKPRTPAVGQFTTEGHGQQDSMAEITEGVHNCTSFAALKSCISPIHLNPNKLQISLSPESFFFFKLPPLIFSFNLTSGLYRIPQMVGTTMFFLFTIILIHRAFLCMFS